MAAGAKRPAVDQADALQAYVEGARTLRRTVLDESQLTLDPDQDTYYLTMLSSDTLSDVIESVSRSRALSGLMGAEPDAAAGT